MKIELKNVKFYEKMSEETNAFTADIYVNGKKCGFAKNDGHGGCTDIQQIGGENKSLFVECVNFLKTQPQINIGTEDKPYMIDCNIESMVDDLFEKWFKEKDQKKLEKKMETSLLWGVPNGIMYTSVNFKRPLSTIPRDVLQNYIDNFKKKFKVGEKFLNTNLVGYDL